jgi:hypothetical protein
MLGRRRGALVGMLLGGCLPKDDLDSYSGAAGVAGEASGGSSGLLPDAGGAAGASGDLPEPDAAAGGNAGASGTPDATTPEPGDGGASVTDAGSGEPLPDAGGDAGTVLAALCASTGGTLEPGTRDCFFVSAAVLSWPNALNACIARQSTLVAIKTPERDQFLTTLLTASAWIGARDDAMSDPAANNFRWRDTSSVSSNNWAIGEPDAVADQFCVAKTIDTAAGPWRDRPCSDANAYICEQSL